jgi:predicted O-methyltransferase YrrM
MNFTEDWFSHNIPNFQTCMDAITEKKMFLEIGSYEGRSTCWLLQNGLSSKGSIVCVDPFPNLNEVEARFWTNSREAQSAEQKVSLMKMTSNEALADMIGFKYQFDFIYVDGNHSAEMVYSDGTEAWKLLKQGGVMLFDDYQYPHEPTGEGIDRFLKEHEGQYDLLLSNYQLAVKKK